MNLKLTNEMRSSVNLLNSEKSLPVHSIKEERRRTGRYIAILVGISLFLLAIYHAWVRRIPIVASLVVPALIMFVYVGWVLYTASRDKHRALDAEAALQAAQDAEMELKETQNHVEISIISSKETSKTTSPESTHKEWAEISTALLKEPQKKDPPGFIKPVILVNDKPVENIDRVKETAIEDLDGKWKHVLENIVASDKLKGFQTRKKFKRKFCRSRRYAAFKRSYSIA